MTPETMDNARKAAALLREAATKVAAALLLLDVQQRECKECGLFHYTNQLHGKVQKQMSGYPIQLRERATELTEQAKQQQAETAHSAKEQ